MGKKIKEESDPKLAKPHEAGAVVELTQSSLHNQFGVIRYIVPKGYPYHLNRAEKSFNKLEEYQTEILKLPIAPSQDRMISDLSFLGEIYNEGFDLVVHTYLGFDHFLFDALMSVYGDNPVMKKTINHWEVLMRLNHFIKKILDRGDLLKSPGYAKFAEIEQKRHAFNHLTSLRAYNSKNWDEVPLAWIISGKYREAFEGSRNLFDEISKIWKQEKSKYDKPGTLTVVRGIKSMHPVKKPPLVE